MDYVEILVFLKITEIKVGLKRELKILTYETFL